MPRRFFGWRHVFAGMLCASALSMSEVSAQQYRKRSQPYCPPVQTPYCPPGERIHPDPNVANPPVTDPQDQSQSPSDNNAGPATPPVVPDQNVQNQFNQAAQNQPRQNNALANVADTGFRGTRAPTMIGDFFGASGGQPISTSTLITTGPFSSVDDGLTYITGNLAAAPGSNVGRLKLAENASLIPRDRIFVNYSYFNDVNIAGGGVDVHRVTPGFEKAFQGNLFGNDTLMSVELRTPFADTTSSTFDALSNAAPRGATEFGNMSVWGKSVLAESDSLTISTGLGLTLPTADDYVLTDGTTEILRVENESVHLLPFIGGLYTPGDRFFAQAMVQFDIDGNGNVARAGADEVRAYDNSFLFTDVSVGYWTYLSSNPSDTIQGIAPILEVHYNTTLDNGQAIPEFELAAPGGMSVTNMVFGLTTKMRGGKSLTFGYATPVGGDRQFDGELRVLFNWFPGT